MSISAVKSDELVTEPRRGGLLRVWMLVAAVMIVGTAVPTMLHVHRYGVLNIGQLLLVMFVWFNVLVTFWEISLYLQRRLIHDQYVSFTVGQRDKPLDPVVAISTAPIRWRDAVRPRRWAVVWSTYALLDDAYASQKSFGFWVDTGNGFSTLIPSVVFIYGLTFDIMPAQWLGMIGIALFWQKFYGTAIYFWAYVHNRQYVGHTKAAVVFVVVLNAVWFIGPAWGLVVSAGMITGAGCA